MNLNFLNRQNFNLQALQQRLPKSISLFLFGNEMGAPTIKMCMMGPRGVGKTSLLTSIYANMNHSLLGEANMTIKPTLGTDSILKGKLEELRGMFSDTALAGEKPLPGIEATGEKGEFEFDFSMTTNPAKMTLLIKDFPGEDVWRHPDEVKSYIAESSAILVAIDTPHLMECGGRYNEGMNRTSAITNFFKQSVTSLSDSKLVMLVPLKCEKYYNAGDIDTVRDKIKDTYGELIAFLKDKGNANGMEGKHCCVIVPILTLGEIEFAGFDMKSDAVVEEIRKEGELPLPVSANYVYWISGAKYNPMNCEQPLYYLLSFVSKLYNKMKEESKSGIWKKIENFLRQTPKIDEINKEIAKLRKNRIKDKDGIEILFGEGKV